MAGLHKNKCDDIVICLSIIYIVLPIIIFFMGWLKFPIALISASFVIFLGYKLYKECLENNVTLICKNNFKYWGSTGLICAIWVYFSGIGSFVYQNGDHIMRNPIFRDLSTYSYPVIYSLSQESEYVQEICGNGNVAFGYYFTWWLPISSVSKLFSLGELSRNVLLFFGALLGIMLIIYLLNRKLGKCTWIVPVILISFSGLDDIPWILVNAKLPHTSHIEWWANYFQYSSNTT